MEFIISFDVRDCFILADGVKIAKRGDEKAWISLEPGWAVFWDPYISDGAAIEITYEGVRVH